MCIFAAYLNFIPLCDPSLQINLLMLALLAFEVTIYRHQDFYRMKNNLTPPVTRTIFHNITRQHLDDGILNCAKYFINYFFYKFGLEVQPSIPIIIQILNVTVNFTK